MNPRVAFLVCGILLVAAGIFLPQGWYDALPRNIDAPTPPIRGITLLQATFVLEGLALIGLSFLRWRFTPLSTKALPAIAIGASSEEGMSRRTALWLLVAVTLIAIALRLINLNTDLWLDEIFTVTYYSRLSLLEVLGGYVNFNNHLMNTLLVKLSIALFGEKEWAVRLPAALFGTATIPLIYWVSRQLGLPRVASLGVALILAASYHHVFFSQNARGYIGNVFFSLLASGLFIKALRTDRLRDWVFYSLAMFLNFASLLVSAYVFAAHVLVGALAVLAVRRQGAPFLPLSRRLVAIFSIVGILVFQLYALILPSAYVRTQVAYSDEGSSGYFSLFSLDLFTELLRGVTASVGLGESPLALIVLLIGVAIVITGFVALLRRNWALALALSLPGAVGALFIIVMSLSFSPRVFLPILPIAIIAVIQGVYSIAQFVGSLLGGRMGVLVPRLAMIAPLLIFAFSLWSLRAYYSVPKQPYRASLEYLELERDPDEIVIVVDLAEQGYRYYGNRLGVRGGEDYFFVQSVEELEGVLSEQREANSFVVTTLPRFLHLRKPELEARIQEDWSVIRTFPATIGNGQISVWAESRQ